LGVDRGFRVLNNMWYCVHMFKLKTLLVIFIQNVRIGFFLKILYDLMFLRYFLKLLQMSTPLLHGEHKRTSDN
jgi:hypothetical protein